jgi:hypothetical protein
VIYRGFDGVRLALSVRRTLGAVALAWGLAACGPGMLFPVQPTPTSEERAVPAVSATPTPTPLQDIIVMTPTPQPTKANLPTLPQSAPAGQGAERVIQLARQDLAQKLSVPIDEIREVSVEAVEWPDTSLGCPQPGMMYAQVITPGFKVVLAAKGQTVEYHTDASGRRVVSCPK